MAPWLNLLMAHWTNRCLTHDSIDNIARILEEPESLPGWVEKNQVAPLALMIPGAHRSLAPFHSMWVFEGELVLGVKGVQGSSPLVAYDAASLGKNLLPSASGSFIRNTELPSIKQFVNANPDQGAAKELLNIIGKSGEKAAKFVQAPAFVALSPAELEHVTKSAVAGDIN